MGLWLTVDGCDVDAAWSYTGFMHFRRRLAAQIDVDLDQMYGFGGEQRPWDTVDHPLVPLLNHSDCDGELAPDDCALVAPALRDAVTGWDEDDYDRVQALYLADLMERADRTGRPVRFH
jgi:hypothetical protein